MMDRRQKFRQNLSPLYLPYYDSLCEILSKEWQPYQGYRTFHDQYLLWRQGRLAPDLHLPIVTQAKAGESAHCYGCATDWTIWEDWNGHDRPLWINQTDPRWGEYIDAIDTVGLKAGKDFGDIDHNELRLVCSWKDIHSEYEAKGMDFVQELLKRMIPSKGE